LIPDDRSFWWGGCGDEEGGEEKNAMILISIFEANRLVTGRLL